MNKTEYQMFRVGLDKNNQMLIGTLLLALILRIVFFHGFFPTDPYYYSMGAFELAEGKWLTLSDHAFSTRWGIIFPVGILYYLFGVNEFTSTLWPMLCSLGTIIVGYLLGRHFRDESTGLLAVFILSVFPLDIIYATQFKADVPLGFWLLLTLYCFMHGEKSQQEKGKRIWFFISGVAFGMAHATKIIAVPVVLPFFLIYIIIRRRIDWQMAWLVLGLFVVLGIEYLIFDIAVDDGFYRFNILSHNTSLKASEASFNSLIDTTSIGAYPFWMFVDTHYVGIIFYILIFTFAFHIVHIFRKDSRAQYDYWPILLWGGMIVLSLTFFPLKTKPYVPLFKQVNYMLMFTAPILVGLALLMNNLPRHVKNICIVLIVFSSLPCLYLSKESHSAHVENSRAIYEFYSKNRDRPLFASAFNLEYLEYFDGLKNLENYRSLNVGNRLQQRAKAHESIDFQSSYVAIDHYYLDYYSGFGYEFPPEILNPPSNWQVVYSYQRKPAYLRTLLTKISDVLYQKMVISNDLHKRIGQKLMSWSHSKPVIIYATG